MTHLERLIALEDMLRRHDEIFPEMKFIIDKWSENYDPETRCGTAGCALGSAAMYKPFMEDGLVMGVNAAYGIPGLVNYEPFYGNGSRVAAGSAFFAGAEFFGITHAESCWLFALWEYEPDIRPEGFDVDELAKTITPVVVADRVKQLIEKYSTDD